MTEMDRDQQSLALAAVVGRCAREAAWQITGGHNSQRIDAIKARGISAYVKREALEGRDGADAEAAWEFAVFAALGGHAEWPAARLNRP